MQKLLAAFILLALSAPIFAAIPATAIWRVSTLGSNTNGGAWDSAGTGSDMSQFPSPNSSGCTAGTSCFSSTANLSETTASTNGTTTITTHNSSAYSSALTGNIVYISGATTTGLATATYSSGGSFTGGSGSSTCILLGFNNSGIQVMATMAVSGTTPGTITVVYPGNGFISAPTTATAYPGVGSAACTGTITITSTLGNSAGWYRATYVSSTTFTVDRNIPTGTSGNNLTVNIGGAFLDLPTAMMAPVAGNIVGIKADGTYTASLDIITPTTGSNGSELTVAGYTSTLGDRGLVTLNARAALPGIFYVTANYTNLQNFSVSCLGGTYAGSSRAVNHTSGGLKISNFVAQACNTANINSSGNQLDLFNVRSTGALSGCTAGVLVGGIQFVGVGVISDSNACHGFDQTANGSFVCNFCVAALNTGASTDGFNIISSYVNGESLVLSLAYNNGRYGVNITGSDASFLGMTNFIAYGNTSKNINFTTGGGSNWGGFQDFNAYTSGSTTNYTAGPHDVILTADPFVNGASLNFALNSTAGGGAALMAAGFPGALQAGGTGHISIGPLQPQAATNNVASCISKIIFNDSTGRLGAHFPAAAETLPPIQIAAVLGAHYGSFADLFPAFDIPARQYSGLRATIDRATAADQPSSLAAHFASMKEQLSFFDTPARLYSGIRSTLDSNAYSDYSSRLYFSTRSVYDGSVTVDSASRLAAHYAVTSERVLALDSVSSAAAHFMKTSDYAFTTDSGIGLKLKIVMVTDSLGLLDNSSRIASHLISAIDTVPTRDLSAIVGSHFASSFDYLPSLNNVIGLKLKIVMVTESIGLSDSSASLAAHLISGLDALMARDLSSRASSHLIASSDSLFVADSPSRGFGRSNLELALWSDIGSVIKASGHFYVITTLEALVAVDRASQLLAPWNPTILPQHSGVYVAKVTGGYYLLKPLSGSYLSKTTNGYYVVKPTTGAYAPKPVFGTVHF